MKTEFHQRFPDDLRLVSAQIQPTISTGLTGPAPGSWKKPFQILAKTLFVTASLALAACTSVGERTKISVGYYTVEGNTFSELNKQISLHGPNVEGVGKALAATRIRMVPDIRFAQSSGKCRITHARINVNARVTLPRHTNIRQAARKLQTAWSNLEEYARLHEAVHVAIADSYALRVESQIKKIRPQENCENMRSTILDVSNKLFSQHDHDQTKFDADEQQRIQKLLAEQNNS